MHPLDWIVLAISLSWIIVYGLRRARGLGLATILDFPLGLAGDHAAGAC